MDQFTGQNLNNLLAFLNRVQLTGEEAPAMVELQRKIREEMARRQASKPPAAPPLEGADPSDPDPSGMDRPPTTTRKKAAAKRAASKKTH